MDDDNAFFGIPPNSGKADNFAGIKGPVASTDGASTEVWAVPNRWEDTDTETNEGNGNFRRVKKGHADPAWIAYVVGTA